MRRIKLLLSRLLAILLALAMTLGVVAQTNPFKYVDAEALSTTADGVQIFSFNENMPDMVPTGSTTEMTEKDGNSSVMADVRTLLKKLKSLSMYIASTPESTDKLQKAFTPMLTSGLHRSIRPLLVVNQSEDNLKVQVVSRESDTRCWRKCPGSPISVLDEDEHCVVGLTSDFVPKGIQGLISSVFPSGK